MNRYKQRDLKIYSINLLMIFYFLISVSSYSSDFRFENLTSEDGLAGNSVSSIIQDKRGFIWFGTQDGLNRYDGKEFKLYEHYPFNKNSLPHNLIQTMYYDSEKDIIWLGTYGGLSSFDPTNESVRHYALSDEYDSRNEYSKVIVSIEKDNQGLIWIGTLSGLISLDPETEKINEYINDKDDLYSLPENSVRDILFSSNGRLWIATYNGLSYFSDGKFYKINDSELNGKVSSKYIMDIEEIDKGILLLGSWDGGVSVFDVEKNSIKNISFPDNRIYFVKRDNQEHIWIGTWGGGLFYVENYSKLLKSEFTELKSEKGNKFSLSNNIGYSFLNDNSGLIWIGTNGGGINKLNPEIIDYRYLHSSLEKKNNTLPDDRIKSLFIDQNDLFWIGTYSNGIYRYNKYNDKFDMFKNDKNNPASLSSDFVNKIYSDSKDNIWVATNIGINRYIPETGGFEHFYYNGEKIVKKNRFSKKSGNPKWDIIYSVYEDELGRLWLGSYLDGVFIWDRDTGKTEHLAPGAGFGKSISNQMVFDIDGDKYGNVWIGTNHGLNLYDIKTGKISVFLYDPENSTGISNNVINRIFKDSAGDMWFGTSGGGLSKLDYASGSFLHFTKKSGLNNNSVTGISEDTRGNLIVTTNKGISIIKKENNEVFDVTYQFGLNDIEIKGDIRRDKDGNFYVSTAGAIYKINTEKYYIQNYEPEIVISDIQVFNDEFLKSKSDNIFSKETIELSWKENSISFNFVSLDYTFPLNNKYKYVLEGFDWDWISVGNRTFANYTNLPSGKYVFRVMGTNSSGKWSDKESSVNIIISPPPYKTVYAYLLYVVAALFLFYSLHIILRGKETEKRLAEENKLKNKLLEVNSELDRLTRIDSLTGVYNRYHFTETLDNGWHLHKRLNLTVSLLMIDIDFFKKYNDTYGHVAGDECLKTFAEVLVEAVSRKTDTVFRYGGEEFLIVLLDTGLEGASVVAEKLREKLAYEKIEHSGSSVSKYLTASIGIVSTDKEKYSTSGEMVLDVDRKLYLAKEHGRNTVIC